MANNGIPIPQPATLCVIPYAICAVCKQPFTEMQGLYEHILSCNFSQWQNTTEIRPAL